eukprot:CAMPEP_0114519148 /NCGR_PEP_ID=MMETSP0109-20121206/18841_1 /TAXON_ID=29199 /ORGANISM="Chlorarachnion reptans, Strain CCCM449" /LENGTH=675 /DNA_ID=CAMNT_0001699853 /DNA_START=27 /DNA_END=2054 /DNA_ORIENTATION=+
MPPSSTIRFSLEEILRKKFFGLVQKFLETEKFMILVVDEVTARIIGSCTRLSDLIDAGFVAVQNIQKKRQQIEMPVLYFISPTVENADLLSKDYEYGKNYDKENQLGERLVATYTRAYVLFTSSLGMKLALDHLVKEERFLTSVRAMSEVFIQFETFESRMFLFNRPYALHDLLQADKQVIFKLLSDCSQKLSSLCVTLNERPNIRYRAPRNDSESEKYCKFIAQILQGDSKDRGDLDSMIKTLPKWKRRQNPGTLLIIDRGQDPIAPLLHEVTYQAALADWVDYKDNIIRIEEKDGKKNSYDLAETDKWWREFRHRHLTEVLTKLREQYEEFKTKNNVAGNLSKFSDPASWDSKDMLKKVRDYPAYREFARNYKKHFSILEQIFQKVKPLQKDALLLEQDMATGMGPEGGSVNSKGFIKRVLEVCQDPSICMLSKARVVMTYIITQGGISTKDKAKVFKYLDSRVVEAIKNLDRLGIHTGEIRSEFRFNRTKSHIAAIRSHLSKESRWAMQQWRYVPRICDTVKQMLDGELDKKHYPYIQEPSQETKIQRTTALSSRRKRQQTRGEDDGGERPRFIVFILGGVTMSEARSIYRLGKQYNVDLCLGSTEILTADEYIKCLAQGAIQRDANLKVVDKSAATLPTDHSGASLGDPDSSDMKDMWRSAKKDSAKATDL